jgi:hypothetical protein
MLDGDSGRLFLSAQDRAELPFLKRCIGRLLGETPILESAVWERSLGLVFARLTPRGANWICNRHTFASRLVMKGIDLRTVGERLGDRSFQMTMRYAHLAADHKRRAVARLDKSGGASGLPRAS